MIDRDDPVGVGWGRSSWRVLGYGRRQPVELGGGDVAQRPAQDASPAGVFAKKPQAHAADLTARLRDP